MSRESRPAGRGLSRRANSDGISEVHTNMNTQAQHPQWHALVSVYDDLEMAKKVVEQLLAAGFPAERMELVTSSLQRECPEVETPNVRATTGSSMASGVVQGAKLGLGLGAGFGIVASVLTASPGLLLGALIYGGMTGGFMGGIAGVENAVDSDEVNLPTREEYQEMLEAGDCLVVVCGTHDELQRAHAIVEHNPDALTQLHPMHGHLFHEHPRQGTNE